jgi:hypothetical protein
MTINEIKIIPKSIEEDLADMKAAMLDKLAVLSFSPSLESNLVNHFIQFLSESGKTFGKPTSIKVEVGTGHSIADVVAYFAPGNVKTDYLHASLTTFDSVILSLIRKTEKISIENLLNYNLADENQIHKSLENLKEKKLIGITSTKELYSRRYNKTKIIAFEAKLKNWKKALMQARNYLSYADESYVVLPSAYAKPAIDSIESFIASGVGLVIVSENSAKVLLRGKASSAHDWRREFVMTRGLIDSKVV